MRAEGPSAGAVTSSDSVAMRAALSIVSQVGELEAADGEVGGGESARGAGELGALGPRLAHPTSAMSTAIAAGTRIE